MAISNRLDIATGDRNTRNVTTGTGAVLLSSPSVVLYSTPLLWSSAALG